MIIRLPAYLVCSVTMLSAVTSYAAAQPDACAEGYVWREAFEGDHVCVGPGTRELVKSDNANAAQRRAARDRDECIEGFVWRLANDKDHVCVPQVTREQAARDNELASTRLASGSPEPPPRKAAVPLPPAKPGCHVFKGGEWRETSCATEEETKRMSPPVVVIQDRIQQVPVIGGYYPWRPPLKFAKIDIELKSDPAVGSVTDVRPDKGCNNNTIAAKTPDRFSVQLNTNFFDTSFGGANSGWVQFVLQTPDYDGSANDGLCVWKVDIQSQIYDNVCTIFQRERTFFAAAAERRTNNSVQVIGLVQRSDDGTNMLTAVAGVPWNDPGPLGSVYAVATPDTIDRTRDNRYGAKIKGGKPNDPLGLSASDNWNEASGDIYGLGCNSMAQFNKTSFLETLSVYTCNPNDPACLAAKLTPYSLPNFAVPVPQAFVTGESNNLIASPWNLVFPNFACPYTTGCVSWGGFYSP